MSTLRVGSLGPFGGPQSRILLAFFLPQPWGLDGEASVYLDQLPRNGALG